MFTVYILYSVAFGKSYCGYTNNISRRFEEHNYTEKSGFTLRYRPWTLIHTETIFPKKMRIPKIKNLTGNTISFLGELPQHKMAFFLNGFLRGIFSNLHLNNQ